MNTPLLLELHQSCTRAARVHMPCPLDAIDVAEIIEELLDSRAAGSRYTRALAECADSEGRLREENEEMRRGRDDVLTLLDQRTVLRRDLDLTRQERDESRASLEKMSKECVDLTRRLVIAVEALEELRGGSDHHRDTWECVDRADRALREIEEVEGK